MLYSQNKTKGFYKNVVETASLARRGGERTTTTSLHVYFYLQRKAVFSLSLSTLLDIRTWIRLVAFAITRLHSCQHLPAGSSESQVY